MLLVAEATALIARVMPNRPSKALRTPSLSVRRREQYARLFHQVWSSNLLQQRQSDSQEF